MMVVERNSTHWGHRMKSPLITDPRHAVFSCHGKNRVKLPDLVLLTEGVKEHKTSNLRQTCWEKPATRKEQPLCNVLGNVEHDARCQPSG